MEGGRRAGSRGTSYRLHALGEALKLGFDTHAPRAPGGAPPHLGYRVHVHLERPRGAAGRGAPSLDAGVPTLSYWCFSPGQAMAALAALLVRSVLLTSGTLAPLEPFAHELGLPFPVRLENPHVIDPSQVWVGVVPSGPSGHALNSSYASRGAREYKEDLGNAIVNFARIVPDGLLVFFASYGLMQGLIEAWKLPGAGGVSVWDRIGQHKPQVVEPREAALFPAAAADFAAKLESPAHRGAAFFAVCRGKVSEGLDFSDRAGRAVVITGIPYATKTDAKVQIKMDVLNEALRARHKRPHTPLEAGALEAGAGALAVGLSGDAWYMQQATRAVNQAMGRVIRHRRDYGAIILCDERFRTDSTRRHLSKWLRDGVTVQPTYGAAAASLTRFFKLQAENAKKVRAGSAVFAAVHTWKKHAPQRRGALGWADPTDRVCSAAGPGERRVGAPGGRGGAPRPGRQPLRPCRRLRRGGRHPRARRAAAPPGAHRPLRHRHDRRDRAAGRGGARAERRRGRGRGRPRLLPPVAHAGRRRERVCGAAGRQLRLRARRHRGSAGGRGGAGGAGRPAGPPRGAAQALGAVVCGAAAPQRAPPRRRRPRGACCACCGCCAVQRGGPRQPNPRAPGAAAAAGGAGRAAAAPTTAAAAPAAASGSSST